MTLTPGTKLGPYEILSPIGAGGMGEVYRARDPRVGRDVAIKVSSEQFTDRFTREIHAVAALNHSNVCTLYDVGTNYLVMELIEGPTLADRIKQGPIPLEESLDIARQIADALEAAHEKGIVHRDLKPGNIKIRPDGNVKVLDFGLAKVEEAAAVRLETSPTLSVAQTAAGVLLGTAAYMSPEQARGKPVDKRADIWAFGVVLYEMLTGKQLFRGETVSDTLAAALKEEPDFGNVPAKVRPLLRGCLEKNPAHRLRDIGDARRLLETAPESTPVKHSWLAWSATALFFLVALGLAFIHFREQPTLAEPVRFQIPFPNKVSLGGTGTFAVSPDGRLLAFSAFGSDGVYRLWLRPFSSLEIRSLSGTEDVIGGIFWSPDSRFIAFNAGGKLKKIDISGGPPRILCDLSTGISTGSWNRDGVILFGTPRGLMCVPAAGGAATPVTKASSAEQEMAHGLPAFLPDGRHFLYVRRSAMLESIGVYAGSLDVMPEEQNSKLLVAANIGLAYVPSQNSSLGQILFLRDQTLMAQPFDEKRLEPAGEPLPIADQVGSNAFYAFFSASTNGVLVYRSFASSRITWIDRDGRELAKVGEPAEYPTFALSKDASRLVISKEQGFAQRNLWILDLQRGSTERLTLENTRHSDPRWSADGSEIIFTSMRDYSKLIFRLSLTSSNPAQIFKLSSSSAGLDDWSSDGRYLLYHDTPLTDLWVLPLSGDQKPVLAAHSLSGRADQAQFSPDGRFIAYNTNESGRFEAKVVPFPPTGEKWQISTEGGAQPTWRRDGRELYFLAPDGTLMAVDVQPGKVFEWAEAHPLFKTRLNVNYSNEQYAPAPDGNRFIVVTPDSEVATAPFNVVLNWTSLIKK